MNTAFGITPEDVENVLSQYRGVEILTPELIEKAFAALDHDAVAVAALDGGDDLETQTTAAYHAIDSQLRAAGIIKRYRVDVTRTVVQSHTIDVSEISLAAAYEVALESAGGLDFSGREKDAEYSVESIEEFTG